MTKFNIVNKDRSNAYATVRLNKQQYEAIATYMHQKDKGEIRFPAGVTLVHQTRGHYRFLSALTDEAPTRALILAIRIASKAIAEYNNHMFAILNKRPLAYVNGTYVESVVQTVSDKDGSTLPVPQQSPVVARLEQLLSRKFRVKGQQGIGR